ncbi:MAG TPA: hypothetical protein VFL57_05900 [Bryobacteraceae bacterium]|nr:hypothetical protein [Bryobacteraceae bacterium]
MAELTLLNPEMRAAVEAQLHKMVSTQLFRRKPRVCSFLQYTVRQTLAGQTGKLKEYSIAVEVFNRPEDFDPRLDSIVRVEARRLRATVDRYYETDGAADPVLIRYRRGNYVPTFERQDERTRETASLLAGGVGGVLIGLLSPDDDPSEVVGRLSASVMIVRPPFSDEVRELIRSGSRRVVLLKPASRDEVEAILGSAAATA